MKKVFLRKLQDGLISIPTSAFSGVNPHTASIIHTDFGTALNTIGFAAPLKTQLSQNEKVS
jgi:hypothetical protein